MRLLLFGAAVLVAVPVALEAQSVPGTRITVDINVVSISRRADTTRIEYVAGNRSTSQEELFQLTIDAPSPVTELQVPSPRDAWSGSTAVADRSVAGWAVLDALVLPGQATPTLAFEAVGLPGVLTSWVRGFHEPSMLDTSDVPDPGPPKTVLDKSVKGFAVGISPYPPGNTPATLLTRLDSLTTRACTDLGWIASSTTCTALHSQLTAAGNAIGAADYSAARAALDAFRGRLTIDRAPSGPVSENAFWLLSVNANYIEQRVPDSDTGV